MDEDEESEGHSLGSRDLASVNRLQLSYARLGTQLAPPPSGATPHATPVESSPAKNVILFIGDGMGFESVRGASVYAKGVENSLRFELFPSQGRVTHNSAGGLVTDSAASATAIATGTKVGNGVISVLLPGDGSELLTLLELYQSRGKKVGLVTTSYLEDATVAAFAAHESSRERRVEVAADYLGQTRPT